ncbi:hypothetical protein [Streptomyces viridosporus]|uniref:hypothetical protein n=1 Tax=Streptomyces viridosporus TaxID=67581 RepID=UPI0036F8F2BD
MRRATAAASARGPGRGGAERNSLPDSGSSAGRRGRPRPGRCRATDDLYRFLGEKAGAPADAHAAETVLTLRRVKAPTPGPR